MKHSRKKVAVYISVGIAFWHLFAFGGAEINVKKHAIDTVTKAARVVVKEFEPAPTRTLMPNEIHFEIFEQNPATSKETLVLIHGLNNGGISFEKVVGELSKKYKVIVYDVRGHGKTKAVGENYSNTVMAQDLKALLDFLQVKSATIVGHSCGGRVAAKFAILFPEKVNAVVIEDMETRQRGKFVSQASWDRTVAYAKKLDKQFNGKWFSSAEKLEKALLPIFEEETSDLIQTRTSPGYSGKGVYFHNPSTSYYWGVQANQESLTEALAETKKPVLYIMGDPKFSAVSSKGYQEIRKKFPAADVETVSGGAHNIHRTEPEKFNDLLEAYLSNHYHMPGSHKAKYFIPEIPPLPLTPVPTDK